MLDLIEGFLVEQTAAGLISFLCHSSPMNAHNHILIILVFDEEWAATHALIRENLVLDLSYCVVGFRVVLGLVEKEFWWVALHTIGWIATEEGAN